MHTHSASPFDNPATLAILAGGEGSRMGGPKSLLRIDDQPVLAWQYHRLHWPGITLLITAPGREHPPGWALFTSEHIDPVSGQGPLRGILTALEHAPATGNVIIMPVDMPALGREHLLRLAETFADLRRARPELLGMMLRRAEGPMEPFPAAFAPVAAPLIHRRVQCGSRAVQGLASEPKIAVEQVDWDAAVWTNLNRPDDLDAFIASRSKR